MTWSAGRPSTAATSFTMFSTTMMLWGTPKPLKAVLEGRLVLQAAPRPRRLGMLYALSMWSRIFSTTCRERNQWGHFTYLWFENSERHESKNSHQPEQIHPQCSQHWRSTGSLPPWSFHHSWNQPGRSSKQRSGFPPTPPIARATLTSDLPKLIPRV